MAVIDEKEACARFDNDTDIYLELIATFLELTPVNFDSLRDELEKGRIKEVTHRIHQLKGAALTLGAEKLSHSASALETELRTISIVHALKMIEEVQLDYKEAVDELTVIQTRLQKHS